MRKSPVVAIALVAVAIPIQTTQAASGPATRITVSATEFRFKLTKSKAPVGKVVFTVVNKGKFAHDFKIAGKSTPELAPGKKAKVTVTFTKSGKYRYVCTLPGHAAAGMKGAFAVARPAVKPVIVSIKAVNGRPVGGIARPTVKKGQIVRIVLQTDVGSQVHLHGYNFEKAVVKGKPTVIQFVANVPGRFELELHPVHALLAQITVKP